VRGLPAPTVRPRAHTRPPQRRGHARAALAVAAALALALVAAAPAVATSTTTKILEECAAGTLPTGYSQQAYNQALKQMPPELAEYSDCPDLIHKAQFARAASSRGTGGAGEPGSGASTAVAAPTPTEQRTLESVPRGAAAAPVPVGGEVLHPGVVHVDLASAFNTLPTPLLVLLVFLLVCALALGGRALRRRTLRAGDPPTPGD
jgi:hypothetical protein